MILGGGDCTWDRTEDEATDADGNLFEEVNAIPGATMTIYAWIGRRSGSGFDEDTAQFFKAAATSQKDADRLTVRHDAPTGTARIGRYGAFIVDLDRRASVEFTIQLLDDDGTPLESEGVPIDIEVESRAVRVEADEVAGGWPDPDLVSRGRATTESSTVFTDSGGGAKFQLSGPTTAERLDTVTFEADCCLEQVHRLVWSDGAPVLVTARPDFELYRERDGEQDRIRSPLLTVRPVRTHPGQHGTLATPEGSTANCPPTSPTAFTGHRRWPVTIHTWLS